MATRKSLLSNILSTRPNYPRHHLRNKPLQPQWHDIGYSQPSRRHAHTTVQADKAPFRVAIIGSGPAGFYAAAKLLEKNNEAYVDMYERLPVPFGLVRFGVAPDHPEVKNCQDRFTEVASSPRFQFLGNITLGQDLPLRFLRPHYDAILFAYGASQDRELGLPGESTASQHIYSARAFVGWYNGLPEYSNLNPNLTAGEDAIVVGQGNVALDVARVLMSDVDTLSKTDMTDYALATLAKSRIRNVRIVGRRGPVQAAFTIKEIRELMQLPGVRNKTSLADLPLPEDTAKLPRASKRLLQLLQKGQISEIPSSSEASKSWSLDFLLSPKSLHWSPDHQNLTNVEFTHNHLTDPLAQESPLTSDPSSTTTLPCNTLFRSIGYKSTPIPGMSEDLGIQFNTSRGIIPNDSSGRILTRTESGEQAPLPGLYAAGWVKRGPTGVIASTMLDAFVTAEGMLRDWAEKQEEESSEKKEGWEGVRKDAKSQGMDVRPVNWEGWRKIDSVERERGRERGKPREKFGSVGEMLEVVG